MQCLVGSSERRSSNSRSDQKSRGLPFCLACEISALEKPQAMVVPKLDHTCGLCSSGSLPEVPHRPTAGAPQEARVGYFVSLSQITSNPVLIKP